MPFYSVSMKHIHSNIVVVQLVLNDRHALTVFSCPIDDGTYIVSLINAGYEVVGFFFYLKGYIYIYLHIFCGNVLRACGDHCALPCPSVITHPAPFRAQTL